MSGVGFTGNTSWAKSLQPDPDGEVRHKRKDKNNFHSSRFNTNNSGLKKILASERACVIISSRNFPANRNRRPRGSIALAGCAGKFRSSVATASEHARDVGGLSGDDHSGGPSDSRTAAQDARRDRSRGPGPDRRLARYQRM